MNQKWYNPKELYVVEAKLYNKYINYLKNVIHVKGTS